MVVMPKDGVSDNEEDERPKREIHNPTKDNTNDTNQHNCNHCNDTTIHTQT